MSDGTRPTLPMLPKPGQAPNRVKLARGYYSLTVFHRAFEAGEIAPGEARRACVSFTQWRTIAEDLTRYTVDTTFVWEDDTVSCLDEAVISERLAAIEAAYLPVFDIPAKDVKSSSSCDLSWLPEDIELTTDSVEQLPNSEAIFDGPLQRGGVTLVVTSQFEGRRKWLLSEGLMLGDDFTDVSLNMPDMKVKSTSVVDDVSTYEGNKGEYSGDDISGITFGSIAAVSLFGGMAAYIWSNECTKRRLAKEDEQAEHLLVPEPGGGHVQKVHIDQGVKREEEMQI